MIVSLQSAIPSGGRCIKDGKVLSDVSETHGCISVFQRDHRQRGAFLCCHQAGRWIPAADINRDIDCVLSACLFESERESLIDTESVDSMIYSLVRSLFPRVHSSLPSTCGQGGKPLLSLSLRHVGKVKGCLPLNRSYPV